MSHDESLHAVYSLDLYRQGSYQHNPMMHGPLLFHANAFFYAIFGVTDATTRIFCCVHWRGDDDLVLPPLDRAHGCAAGRVVLLISLSLLFHSRYIRDDIYTAFFAMVWVYRVLHWKIAGPSGFT